MDPKTNPSEKLANSPSSRDIVASGSEFANLLSQAGTGIRIKGFVTGADPGRNVAGTGKSGKAYSFWNLRVTVLAGPTTVQCTFTADDEKDLPRVGVGSLVTLRVTGGRVNNGTLGYDVELDQ